MYVCDTRTQNMKRLTIPIGSLHQAEVQTTTNIIVM